MRYTKLFLTAILATLALTALTATSALAAETEGILPKAAEAVTFTGAQEGEGELVTLGGNAIKCLEGSISGGVVTTDLVGTIKDIDFKKCKAFGFPANSLGDPAETILTGALKYEVCLITPASLLFGLFVTLEKAVHIEVPLLAVLVEVEKGSTLILDVASNAKAKVHAISATGEKGDPKFKTCTNDAGKVLTASLLASLSHKAAESSVIIAKYNITFTPEVEFMDAK